MELERKAEYIVDEIDSGNNLEAFSSMLTSEVYDIHRDEFKLKLLDLVSKGLKTELDKHVSDGSCKGGCDYEKRIENGFGYVEQEYDKVLDDISLYGTMNRYNADVFGEQFTTDQKSEISNGIDLLLTGQLSLTEGQLDLSEELKTGFEELKELIFVLNKKHWTDNFRGQIWSAIIGLGINSENAQSLMSSLEKSIGV